MPEYLNTTWTGDAIAVPPSDRLRLPGRWVPIRFDTDVSDAAGHHSGDSPLICNGPRYLDGKLVLRLEDFGTSVELQIRQYEVSAAGDRVEEHEPHEFYTSAVPVPTGGDGNPLYPARMHYHYHVFSYVNSGHRFGLEISQWPSDPSAAPTGKLVKAQFCGTLTSLG
ncbi:hypothetical protein [Actinomadura miaoliensis]|uniref:Uncharacterized protein n=1 Tax=Actinomadura miaoliensis TaxID=430685 RepID=A0ABP7W8A3_9ACTN